MLNFAQFLAEAAERGEAVNVLFEGRLFDLVGVLHKITDALTAEGIPHELIGGLAVFIHVEEADPTHSTLTRDVDLMVRRADLDRIKLAAAKNAVHLIFSGEKVRPHQATPNPPIAPEKKRILGEDVLVIPVVDLLRMKLSAFRDKDRVHIRSMDAAGLISTEVEEKLPGELRARLQQVRETE